MSVSPLKVSSQTTSCQTGLCCTFDNDFIKTFTKCLQNVYNPLQFYFRLQRCKYFNVEQIMRDLKQFPAEDTEKGNLF